MEVKHKLCIPGQPAEVGGPSSFQKKLTLSLLKKKVEIVNDLSDWPYDAILLLNGTRHLIRLLKCKKKHVRIIQRLGGLNWQHRYLPVGIKGYLRAEIWNVEMRIIRSLYADHVVYQSHFVEKWWEREFGPPKVPYTVIYNGVDLEYFNPIGDKYKSQADVCIISVEGTQGNDKFDTAIELTKELCKKGFKVELLMFGSASKNVRLRYSSYPFVNFLGIVRNKDLPYYYRGADFYISTDIIAACPNSVIEALACGTPVLGYRAGVLPEMLNDRAGRCVEYKGDPWKMEPPGSFEELADAALEIVEDRKIFGEEARNLAEERYGLDHMVDAYYEVLFG